MAAAGALAIVLVALIASTVADSSPDAVALQALRSGLQDPDGALKNWDPDLVDPCTWFHISCDDNLRVTRIDLGSSNLSSTQRFYNLVGVPGLSDGVQDVKIRDAQFCIFILDKSIFTPL